MVEKATISRNQLVSQILRIGHGDLKLYLKMGLQAAKEEPELFGHLIAWNQIRGEVRDSKVALPVIALRGPSDEELMENAVAHLASLDPRNLVRAIQFNKSISINWPVTEGSGKLLKQTIQHYLKAREENQNWWDRTVLQHKKSIKTLYAIFHIKPNQRAQDVLFKRIKPKGSVFEAVAKLKSMDPEEAAGTILTRRIPFLVAVGALGGIKGKPDVILALIEQTSGSELITNTGMFQRMGVFDNPVLKAAFDKAVERAKEDKRVSTYKASKAASKVKDKRAVAKMTAVQEEKLEQLGGIEGDWLVLGDRSASMSRSIEIAKLVAATITQQVKGQVNLVFFNQSPIKYDITGKSLDEIKKTTQRVSAGGMTSIGCGLELIREAGVVVNGIAICSDGGENTGPLFPEAYKKYVDTIGIEPTVYLLWVPGDNDNLSQRCERLSIPIQKYDVSQMDYFALPNLVKTMRASKFMLVDEIMNTPLLKLADVFSQKGE